MNDDEDRLIRAFIASRSEKAFSEIVRRYQHRLHSFAVRILGDRHLAEDAVSETFAKAYYAADSYSRNGAFSSWLYKITLNTCRVMLRAERRRPETRRESVFSDESRLSQAVERVTQLAQNDEKIEAVKKAVSALPAADREVMVLREYQGLSYAEIANITGRSIASVRSRIYRARSRIGEILYFRGFERK